MGTEAITGERARTTVAAALQRFLADGGVRAVQVAQDTAEPPMLAYLTHFPRLTVVLDGRHVMSVARGRRPAVIRPTGGPAVYCPANCWNLPDYSEPVRDVTFLFGPRHVGVSLTDHPGGGPDATPRVTKTSVPRLPNTVLTHLLDALTAAAPPVDPDLAEPDLSNPGLADPSPDVNLARVVAQAVLHAGLGLLGGPSARGNQKAHRLYESIRLYVQENAHTPISRESVAAEFGLTPNHVSRLFRQEGELGFNETLNQARVDRAKYLLGQYGTSLKEVARHCGFTTTAYFCRTFKKVTMQTPTEFRLDVPRPVAAVQN